MTVKIGLIWRKNPEIYDYIKCWKSKSCFNSNNKKNVSMKIICIISLINCHIIYPHCSYFLPKNSIYCLTMDYYIIQVKSTLDRCDLRGGHISLVYLRNPIKIPRLISTFNEIKFPAYHNTEQEPVLVFYPSYSSKYDAKSKPR